MKFQTTWTAEKIKQMRAQYSLSQHSLALLLRTPQQRISEWESGRHTMRRLYSEALTSLDEKLMKIQNRTRTTKGFHEQIAEVFGVQLEKKRCSSLSKKKKSAPDGSAKSVIRSSVLGLQK